MPTIDNLLKGLDHFKPLWDFLTAVGTVGLAAVTFYLARRIAKAHLKVAVSLVNENKMILVTITNDGEAAPVLLKCVWRSREFECALMDFQVGQYHLNGHPSGVGNQRLVNGDVLTVWAAMDQIATQAETSLPKDITPGQLDQLLRVSLFACVTTTGESFATPLTPDLQGALANRINLIRTPI